VRSKRCNSIVRARCRPPPRRRKDLRDDRSIDSGKLWSHHCGRSLRACRAAVRAGRSARHTHVHVLAAAMRRLLHRKHTSSNREQQHAHEGESDRYPLAESTQHVINIAHSTGSLFLAEQAINLDVESCSYGGFCRIWSKVYWLTDANPDGSRAEPTTATDF
jgi:hypothetical protein